ncbi:hypothetical protein TrST_g13178 [Triparma strigata]|uniref:Uncharacterized protein n=1 Tax=Triparma strigata TaxID=1606541 RepID=A0A9W7BXY9_9STRA|nr:hypothetical protein TrST_g13178 [Triparma strigata]
MSSSEEESDNESDYSGADSGSGSDSDSDSNSDSGSGDSDESGSGSDGSDDENDDDVELGMEKEAEEQVIKDDVQMIVELCSQMDASLNRIRLTFKPKPQPPLPPGGGVGEDGDKLDKVDETPREEGERSMHDTPELNQTTPSGSHPGSASGPHSVPDENVDPASNPPSRHSSRSKLSNPNWDALSSDSMQPDFFTPKNMPNGINLEPGGEGVIDGSDLYKYNVGGVGYGGGLGEERRGELIQEAIKALMEADD